MKLNIFGDNDESYVKAMGNAENLNCYMFPTPSAENPWSLVGCMGTALFAEIDDESTVRGSIVLNNIAYIVCGTSLYSVTDIGTVTSLGAVPGLTDVSMITDGVSIMIVNRTITAYYYHTGTSTFSTVAMPYIGFINTYLDGFAVVTKSDGQFFISAADDIYTFAALDFATAQYLPDGLLHCNSANSDLVLFGENTTEFWTNTSNVNFTFAPIVSQTLDIGVAGRHSVCKNKTLYFLGDDLVVYQLQGYSAVPISTESENIVLRQIYESEDGILDVRNSYMLSYTEHGHDFVQLTVPNRLTICYNVATQQWHKVKHWNYETSIAKTYFRLNGLHYITGIDGKVYQMSKNFYSDAEFPLRRGRKTQHFSSEGKIMHWNKIKFIMSFGETTVVDGSQGTDPVLMLRWSFDGGHVWRSEKTLPLGANGRYNEKCIKRNCGASRQRQLEFYVTDPVPFHVIDAIAEID